MIKYAKYIFITIIILSCNSIDRKNIEAKWISRLDIDLEEKQFLPNVVLMLDNGKGLISEIGKEGKRFDYTLKGDNIIIDKSKRRLAEVLSHSKNLLKLNFDGLDTIELVKIESNGTKIHDLKEAIFNHSFEIINQENSKRLIAHFTKNEILILSDEVYNMANDEKFFSLSFSRVKYSLDTLLDIVTIEAKGLTKKLGYPLIGTIELVDKKIRIKTYSTSGVYESKLINTNLDNNINTDILTKNKWRWGTIKGGEEFNFLDNGKILHEKNGINSVLKWSIDESGNFIIFEDEYKNKKYGVVNFDKSIYRIGYEFSKGAFSDILNVDN